MNTAVTTDSPRKAKSPRLREEFARWMKMGGKSENTIRDYIGDVLDFVLFSGRRDPRLPGPGLNALAPLAHAPSLAAMAGMSS